MKLEDLWRYFSRNDKAEPAQTAKPAPEPKAFMDTAQEMRLQAIRTGDQAYGAVVVKGGKIVGFGPSRVVINTDPSGHAEMEALRDAARRLKTQDLTGCVMYSTSPPCAMCEAAAHWARIDRLVSTSALRDLGKPRLKRCST
jgi:tRNA(Arg) A34 adenosine deaminase TadA